MSSATRRGTSLDWTDAPVKSDKWRNLAFSKTGKSSLGLTVWASEEIAKDAAVAAKRLIMSGDYGWICDDGRYIARQNFSHIISVPVKS